MHLNRRDLSALIALHELKPYKNEVILAWHDDQRIVVAYPEDNDMYEVQITKRSALLLTPY